MLCLSTGHISERAAQDLSLGMAMQAIEDPNERDEDVPEWVNLLIVYPHDEYGWLIAVGSARDDHTIRAHVPHEFLAIFDKCEAEGCDWLLLDRDADGVDDLPTFDW